MLDEGIAFEITCKRGDLATYASHLHKIVSNTNLAAILWANIVSGTVRLERIGKGGEKNSWAEKWACLKNLWVKTDEMISYKAEQSLGLSHPVQSRS